MQFDYAVVLAAWPALLKGLLWTLIMVLGSLAIGSFIGLATCLAKLMMRGPIHWTAKGYIEFYRTIPEMVNIFWIYYCLPLVLDIRLSPVACGLIALSLYAGAFLAEIYRAGIQAVPAGQIEAAYACGVPRLHIWRAIIAPQALRLMIPAFIAFLTDLVKVSGLLSAISVGELVYQASILSNASWKHLEFFTAVGIVYFVLIAPLSLAAQALERRLVHGR